MTSQPRRAAIDATHAVDAESWVESAQDPHTDFPVQNLPLGCARIPDRGVRPCIAIGDEVLDLVALGEGAPLGDDLRARIARCAMDASLNPLLEGGRGPLASLRAAASAALRRDGPLAARARAMRQALLHPTTGVELLVPVRVGDYTDFYASLHHATNVGRMFRPDAPLLPNYKWIPIGYHGRASSIVASGTPVRRPVGQSRDDPARPPLVGPSQRLDYEVEVGIIIGAGNALGTPIPIGDAERHVAGLCLVNDWSARDIQAWEYQPLGPFLAKSFATTVSPWLVTLDALAPFRVAASQRDATDPPPLPYLADPEDRRAGGVDIRLEVLLSTARMRAEGRDPFRVSKGSLAGMYWTLAQLVTHQASNGTNLRAGDLLASGTVSGADEESRGCLLERTHGGAEPLLLPGGERRRFLEDGDEVTMRAWCERDGARRIGFGECRGIVAG